MRNNFNKGFTLVEILAVVAILATIVTATVAVMNPIEMLQQAEDAVRLNDINSIHQVLTLFRSQRPGGSIGEPNIVYVSIPSTSSTCVGAGLPALPTGWEYRCVTAANLRNINGTGWIPVNFAAIPGRIPFTILPIDPVNTAASGSYYAFVTDRRTWALATMTRSKKHSATSIEDGGTDSARFEAGTNLSLWTSASGLVGYWNLNEGVGTTANDLSGRGNTGTLQPALGPTWTSGRVANALSFDGVDDFIRVSSHPSLDNVIDAVTVEAWINIRERGVNEYRGIVVKQSPHIVDGCRVGYGFVSSWGSGDSIWFAVHPEGRNDCDNWVMPGMIFSLNNWYHIVGTYSSITGRQEIYVNGSLRGTRLWPINTRIRASVGTPLEIGRNTMAGWEFNGLIDEVRIYNRALSATEIMANFNATR